jgi:hypothetical protein
MICLRHEGAGGSHMNVIHENRSTLDRYLPLLIGLLVAFFAGKALKRMFWTVFGMYWALHASGIHLFG